MMGRHCAASALYRAMQQHAAFADAAGAATAAEACSNANWLFASGRSTWCRGYTTLLQPSMQSAARAGCGAPGVAIASEAASTQRDMDHSRGMAPWKAGRAGAPQQSSIGTLAGAAAAAAGNEAGAPAAAPRQRRRTNWKQDRSIAWTPRLAAQAAAFWQGQGVSNHRQLQRLARWTKASPWFRNLQQLEERMARWRQAAARHGRGQQDVLALVLADRGVIERGADPDRMLGNLNAVEEAFAAHGLSVEGVRRSRVLQNKMDTIVERIPMFIEEVEKWPVQVDPGAMLQRAPGLLASQSTNFAVYGRRVAALHAWAPPGLDLGKVLVRAPTLLNLFPELVKQRHAALQGLLELRDAALSQFVTFAPSLLSRRTETLAWKIAYHKAYAKHRRGAGFGDELTAFYGPDVGGVPGQFPSRLGNLLLQSAERLQRLEYLVRQHAGDVDVFASTGYGWVRQRPDNWEKRFPKFAQWLAEQQPDPAADVVLLSPVQV